MHCMESAESTILLSGKAIPRCIEFKAQNSRSNGDLRKERIFNEDSSYGLSVLQTLRFTEIRQR